MSSIITDDEISSLLSEKKVLPANWRSSMVPRPKSNTKYSECDIKLVGDMGSRFVLWIKQCNVDQLDFTVGLRVILSNGHHAVLKRYNGPSHKHINHLEIRTGKRGSSFKEKCHVHIATERYQRAHLKIDGFAKPARQFSDRDEAIDCMIRENGFVESPQGDQKFLFYPI